MGDKRRNLLFLLLAAAIVVVAGAALYVVWRSQRRNDLATYWGFAVGVVALAVSLIVGAWNWRNKPDSGTAGLPDLDQVADQLAEAVQRQWEVAARERKLLWPEPIPVQWRTPSAAMVGPVTAAVGSKRFEPLPGLQEMSLQHLQVGDIHDLHAVYGGLGSGRLVIAGAPGSGKSGAAVLLVLAALRYREHAPENERAKLPVPVIFTLNGWDPEGEQFQDWLIARLRRTYPLFAGKAGAVKAARLLANDKIAVILDGLDEIPRDFRPATLQAISDQAAFRVVLLTRSAEMVAAATHSLFDGAVALELQDVDPMIAADYLTRVQLDPPPAGWSELINRLRCTPDSPLAHALNSPLVLTLVRDTYRRADNVHELIDFCDVPGTSKIEIEDHLLDRLLPVAYAPHPGEGLSGYDFQVANRTLGYIAMRMKNDCMSDLAWWRIRAWTSNRLYTFTTVLAGGLIGVIVGGLGYGLLGAIIGGLFTATWTILSDRTWMKFRRVLYRDEFQMPALLAASLRWRDLFRAAALSAGIIGGVVSGMIFGLGGWLVSGPSAGLRLGLVFGFTVGLLWWTAGWFAFSMNADRFLSGKSDATPLTPRASWHRVQGFGLVSGLRLGLVAGVVIGLGHRLSGGFVVALLGGLSAGLVGAIVFPQTWRASVAFTQLSIRWHSPIRFMRFLDDARERGVLRTVGPVYQFRHARLQDRLAEQATGSVPADDPSKSSV